MADISCGDPWYEASDGQPPGFALVVIRAERGQEIVRGAMEADCLGLRLAETWKLRKSQVALASKKGEIWGRHFVQRLLGLPVPPSKAGTSSVAD